MLVRDLDVNDHIQVERLHGLQGHDYRMPSLDSPLVLTKKVAVQDGKVIGACFTKLQVETFLVLDPALGPAEKFEATEQLNNQVVEDSFFQGLDQAVAYLPPGVESKFQKRLKLLGWAPGRPEWTPWSFELVDRSDTCEQR